MRTPTTKYLSADFGARFIDSDSGGLTPLLMDLRAALAYLTKKDASQDITTFGMIRRHARRTYDEAVSVLDSLTVSDLRRRYLEAQLAVLKGRLMLLGEKFHSV